ncbi:MAG TPA: tail-specific protease, partial [Chitinophagaceae bacterium]|nr:tail-specific protease [Chitinophagaceae bacterium]
MSRKVLPLLLLVVFGGMFWAFAGSDKKNSEDISQQQQLLMVIGQILEQKHYSPQIINDSFSAKVFNKYLENLDGDKSIFLKTDIASFQKYKTALDEEIHGDAPMKFFSDAGSVFLKRLDEASAIAKNILSKPFDFSVNETAELESETAAYPADENARQEAWRKRLKFMTLERFADLQQQRETSNGKDSSVNKTDDELQAKARNLVLASVNRNFNRQKLLLTEEQQFATYVNTITDLMDPHTEYFPPVEKRGFDEEMSGRFYGIGAQLKEENGAIKIASLVTGGPAWKSGNVQVNFDNSKMNYLSA